MVRGPHAVVDHGVEQLGLLHPRELRIVQRAAARATLTVNGGPVTVRVGDELHIDVHPRFTITLPDDGDDPSLTVRVQ